MFCAECGSDAGDGARFCPVCGSSMDAPVSPAGDPGAAEELEAADELEELRTLAAEAVGVERVEPGADGHLSHPLFAAAEAAFSAGHRDAAEDILLDDFASAAEGGKSLLIFALLRANDREFHGHGVEGLTIRRIEFAAPSVSIEDLDMTLSVTDAGAMIPKPTRPGERVLVNLGTEIQLFGPNDDDERAAAIHSRGFDSSGLYGKVEVFYEMRVMRRLLWGFGHCLLTDQRACGLVFQRDQEGKGASPEREAMPDMFAGSDDYGTPVGSVLVFSAARELFDDKQLRVPVLTRRIPDISLMGDIDLILSALRVVDEHDLVVRPGKGQIAAAVEAFLPFPGRPDGG